jgi:hypothetical protein
MIIKLQRVFSGKDSSVGVLFIDTKPFCFVVEDEARNVKLAGETRIPSGVYPVTLRNEGGMTKRYAEKFPDIHEGMLWLREVPNFSYVYIHIGNTDDHTEGCLLVNYNAILDPVNGGGSGGNSTQCYRDIYKKITDAMKAGEQVFVVVEDETS